MYSFKDVANVLQDRNKDVKMKTVLDLSNNQCLLPPTGYCVPMLKIITDGDTFVLSRVNCTMNYTTYCFCVLMAEVQYCVDFTMWTSRAQRTVIKLDTQSVDSFAYRRTSYFC